MDWTKAKTKHFLYSDLTKSQKGDLIDLLCLTAHIEKIPSKTQMLQVCRKDALKVLQNYFKSEATLLEDVLKKVLEDVERVNHKKAVSRETSNRYNQRHKNIDRSVDTSIDGTEKRREEKNNKCFSGNKKKYKTPTGRTEGMGTTAQDILKTLQEGN